MKACRTFARLLAGIILGFVAFSPPATSTEHAKYAALFNVATHSDMPSPKQTFDQIFQLLLHKYYSDELDETSLYYAAAVGMLRHVSPPDNKELAKLWSGPEYQQFLNTLVGVKASIGVKSSFNQADGSLTVTEVQRGSPAQGLVEVHDRILRLDGEPLLGKSLADVNARLNGPDGSWTSPS